MQTVEIKFQTIEQFNYVISFLQNLKIEFKIKKEAAITDDCGGEIDGQMLAPLLAQNPAFDFLKAEEEDIYSDVDLIEIYH